MTQQEICEIAKELERIRCAYRHELKVARDFREVAVKPGESGILLQFPSDTPCSPGADNESLTVDVDYTVNVPNNNDVSTNSIEKLSLRFEWGAANHFAGADLLRGTAGTFIGQRMIVRWIYEVDEGTEQAPITQPEVGLRASIVRGNVKASPGALWNLRKTVFVGNLAATTESTFFRIPEWAIYAYLQIPGALFAGTALILNQYAAPNGTLLASSTIGHGEGSASPVVQGARYFTIDNIGNDAMPSIRVIWVLGQ